MGKNSLQMSSVVFEGYQRLAADVITTAWEDLKTNAELEILRAERDELNLITLNDLTKPQKNKRNSLLNIIVLNGKSRYFFEERNYELWAETAGIDSDMLFEAYVAYIHSPLEVA